MTLCVVDYYCLEKYIGRVSGLEGSLSAMTMASRGETS